MKIATIVGARPQFIKAAAISRAIVARTGIDEILIHTGQHFDANMSDVFFSELDIRKPDHHLGIGGGTHGQNTGRMIEAIERVLIAERPDWVLVYGDTDSTLAGALSAAKLHVPIAHVEAGLRSFNRRMPEEINRVLTDHASDLLFAPTATAIENLANEGIASEKVKLVGDVMYDATIYYESKARKPDAIEMDADGPFALCTIHRAENTDDVERLKAIVECLNKIAERMPVWMPMHPRTLAALKRLPNAALSPSVHVIDPIGFLEMTWMLSHCQLVVTDSGGLQKEAYFHYKPCLTLRDETEWVELINSGFNRLISPFSLDLSDQLNTALATKFDQYHSIYGVGDAAQRIVSSLVDQSAVGAK